jgi:hypothetical protein
MDLLGATAESSLEVVSTRPRKSSTIQEQVVGLMVGWVEEQDELRVIF